MGKAEKPTLIVGAGLAGLACALTVRRAGRTVLLFAREEVVGGRVRTDGIEGYRLDRGFQVLLTAYPEARRFLNFEELDLRSLWTDWVPCSIPSVLFRTSSELAC